MISLRLALVSMFLAGATVAAAELIPRKFAKMLKQFHRFGTPTKLHSLE